MPALTSLPAAQPRTLSTCHLPEDVQAAQQTLTDEQRISVDFLTWEILGLLNGRSVAQMTVLLAADSAAIRRGRLDLEFQFSDDERWACGIRYGEPPAHPGFPSRHMFDFDSFFAAPTDPASCRLVMEDLRECLATAAQVALALQEADPVMQVRWLTL